MKAALRKGESPQMRVGSGGASSMPPQQRNSIEMSAPGEWSPHARRAITRSLLLVPSTGPFVTRVSRYARMPSACFRIVRSSFTAPAETSPPPLADEQRRSHHRVHAGGGGGPSDAAPVELARGRHSTLIAQPRSNRSPVHAGVAALGPILIPAAASRASTGASAAPVQRGDFGTSGSGRPSARVKRTAPASSSVTRRPPSCTAR